MIEQCLYKNPNGRYLDIRQDRIQLCGYDRCAAALMNVFGAWTSWKRLELSKLGKKAVQPWVFLSKRQLRYDLLGTFGEPSIERGISVLSGLDLLQTKKPEKICGAIWYLFNYEKANSMLKEIVEETSMDLPKHPKRRNGWVAQQASLGNNAEVNLDFSEDPFGNNAEDPFGNNAEDLSAIMPTNRNLNEEPNKTGTINPLPPLVPSEPENQSQNPEVPPAAGSPTLDGEGDSLEEQPRSTRRSWKRPKPERPHGMSDRMRQLREGAHKQAAAGVDRLIPAANVVTSAPTHPIDPGASYAQSETFPARWNRMVPARPVDIGLLAPNPKAYREPVFAQRFDEICQKAAALIAAGANVQFGFLLSTDRTTEQYRWQQLLAGQLDWMKPRANGNGKDVKKPVDGVAMAAQMRKERLEREAKERANQDAH